MLRKVSKNTSLGTSLPIRYPVPPKVKGSKGRREIITPLSGLDIESLLRKHKPKTISKENAIPDFKHMLTTSEGSDEVIFEAVKQISDVIRDLMKSLGGGGDQRAQANITVMREEMIEYEFPELYNNFLRDLKAQTQKKEFGDKREFWTIIKNAKLGLIDTNTLEVADVSPEEASEVCSDVSTF